MSPAPADTREKNRTTSTAPFSLQSRLRWGLLMILLAVFVALWFAGSFTIHKLVDHYLISRLEHDADTLVMQLQRKNGTWQFNQLALGPIYRQPNSGHYFVIQADNQRIVSPSLNGYPLWTPEKPASNPYKTPAPRMIESNTARPTSLQDSSLLEPVLVKWKDYQVSGHPVRVFVAEDHSPIERYLRWFYWIFALVALVTLAGTTWLTRRLVHRSFTHLNPLEQQLRQFASGSGPFRLPSDLPEEVSPLAQALEQSLSAQSQQLQRYRHANANLAHALKTPLHIIFQQLTHPAMNACPHQRDNLQKQAERLHALLERELKSARLAGNNWQAEAFSSQTHLQELLDAMRQLHPKKQISASELPGPWPMEKEDAFELLGTVLDNACKWAKSRVMLDWHRSANTICLNIDDDGPGVPVGEHEKLVQRGHRLDETTPGNGLGLSIAQEIVQRYQGSMAFGFSPLGGLRVTVCLPSSNPA